MTGTATNFNGGADININTTAVDATTLNGRNWTDAVGANTLVTRDPS